MRLLQAINTLLVSIGQEMVDNLDEPSALMAKHTLDFVINELPYDTSDFQLDYESLPREVYNFVVVRACRKFQTSMISSEELHKFTQEDEASAKRMIIIKKIIPKSIQRDVEDELSELLSFANKVPKAIKDNLALLKLQGLLFLNSEEYPLNVESIERSYIDFKKRLIVNKDIPDEVLLATTRHLFAKYGFSGVIPQASEVSSKITDTLRAMATYEFQKSILAPDDYVITEAEKNQDEIDLRLAIIANRLMPSALLTRVRDEFIASYGYTQSELTGIMKEYITNKAMFRLQSILIPDEKQRPISVEDMDNAEASLITNLIVPKAIYFRAFEEIKLELGINSDILPEEIPEAVKLYAKYKGAYIHQPTAIINPRKYVLTEDMVIRQKALASQSLPNLSLLNTNSTKRIIDKDSSPTPTTPSTRARYRLKVGL